MGKYEELQKARLGSRARAVIAHGAGAFIARMCGMSRVRRTER